MIKRDEAGVSATKDRIVHPRHLGKTSISMRSESD